MQGSMEAMDVDPIFDSPGREELVVEQATVFLEDAVRYRSIHHKIDHRSLRIYRLYYSPVVRWGLTFVIVLDLGLAFFEHPSSLTLSSDPRFRGQRPQVPCGVLEVLEILFLLCLVGDVIVKSHVLGRRQLIKNRWLLAYMSILFISFVDIFVSLCTGCGEVIRIRRLLRPFFLVQNSSLTKKLLRAIKRTLPEIMSVLFLLFLHLFFFTMFGMLLFPRKSWSDSTKNVTQNIEQLCKYNSSSDSGAICEGSKFFPNLADSMRSLFVLLTTANNPDVMMPAYMKNRFYFIYFFLFTLVGLYCFLNLLTAVIYNQFRGYLMKSLESSLFRKRLGVRAAFEVLCTLTIADDNSHSDFVPKERVKTIIEKANLDKRKKQILNDALRENNSGMYNAKQFQDLFEVLDCLGRTRHRPPMSFVGNILMRNVQLIVSSHLFDYFGDFIAGVNVIFVSAMLDNQYDDSVTSSHSALAVANLFFVLYYLFEQSMKLWALGWQRYISLKGNMYCGVVTLLLVVLEVIFLCLHGSPFSSTNTRPDGNNSLDYLLSVANLTRIINMLIIFRLLRIVPNIRALSLVAETLLNLLRNLSPFLGLIVAIYYVFAVLGMILFPKVTDPTERCAIKDNSTTKPCSTLSFDQLEYYANNFDDFAASLVLLWDIMVVNNWHVFLKAYAQLVNSWSQLYFLAWYLVSVIISINLFVALILEAFVDQWETRQRRNRSASATTLQTQEDVTRFHQMFRAALVEPQEVEILSELRNHEFLRLNMTDVIID